MSHSSKGYFRSPTVFQNQVVFVCEDDLWQVPLAGGTAQRMTNSRGNMGSPCFSPEGQWVACCGRDEGNDDIYILPSAGGTLKRLTHLNTPMRVARWSPDGSHVLFWSTHQAVHRHADATLYQVPVAGGGVEKLPFGPAHFIDFAPDGKGIVLGRNASQNFRWKRYRGGLAGELWVRLGNKRKFVRLLAELNGVCPLWIGSRLYFISDHEGLGNLYSCRSDGTDLRPETFQEKFYARSPASDGQTVVYHAGGELFSLDLDSRTHQKIEVAWASPRAQLQRKFFYGDEYFEEAALHPQGHSVAMVTRGALYSMPLWERAAVQHGHNQNIRSRLVQWLPDGRLATLLDLEKGEEKLAVFPAHPQPTAEWLVDLPAGRVQSMASSPLKNQIAFTNNRLELFMVDFDLQTTTLLDASTVREIEGLAFSPDGNWLAYSKSLTLELVAIFLLHLATKEVHQVTQPVRYDFAPAFDPDGHYLYFLSARHYNPIADTLQMGYTFSRSIKPYLLTLQQETSSPFLPEPQAPGKQKDSEEEKSQAPAPSSNQNPPPEQKEQPAPKPLTIHLEGIEKRLVEFPVKAGLYEQILGLSRKVLFTEFPLMGELEDWEAEKEEKKLGLLWCYDFEKQELEELANDVSWIQTNPAAHTLLYCSENRLRALEAGSVVPEENEVGTEPSRKSGWLDLNRIRVSVDYAAEWQQMFREAWRLQKEFFWRKDLSGVDWEKAYEKYAPLLPNLGSRGELSDLIWEMQGELGTSHAYEYGGDYPPAPAYWVGRLGADLTYDRQCEHYVFEQIYEGDLWKKNEHSPLCEPGQRVAPGDQLLAINGVAVDAETSPDELLVHQAGQEVLLSVKAPDPQAEVRHLVVKTLPQEQKTRYRDWVNGNREFVHAKTNGRVGYLHIPDMQFQGIAEFHRGFLSQTDKAALIIDVRYNAGGMVSSLILEKLMHRHLGYDVPRWGLPESYPFHTLHGHLLVLANEFTGSDGDMFCQSVKTLQLAPILGKRTWGGVIGIDNRYHLVDGTTTTQPQYSAWFHKGGWSVENYGVEPDIAVEFPPHAYAQNQDPQLKKGIETLLKRLEKDPIPAFEFDPNAQEKR